MGHSEKKQTCIMGIQRETRERKGRKRTYSNNGWKLSNLRREMPIQLYEAKNPKIDWTQIGLQYTV